MHRARRIEALVEAQPDSALPSVQEDEVTHLIVGAARDGLVSIFGLHVFTVIGLLAGYAGMVSIGDVVKQMMSELGEHVSFLETYIKGHSA